MIEKIVEIVNAIKVVLVEVGSSITVTDTEIKICKDLVQLLDSVQHAVDSRCRKNSALPTAKRISPAKAIYRQRQKKHMPIHLLEYLHDPTFLMENKHDTFGECRKHALVFDATFHAGGNLCVTGSRSICKIDCYTCLI